ncbi:MAG: hypothetical protein AAB420_03105 [Patescibacteria group bacterium]
MAKQKLPFKNFDWTAHLAYAVGLLTTDGNLSPDGRHIHFRSNDIDLIETFKDCLNIKNKAGVSFNKGLLKNPSYKVQFGNVQLYRWLQTIGLQPNKTYTIAEVKVPDEYFRDFLRGHLDGDGSVIFYQDNYNFYKGRNYSNSRLYVYFISASEKHIRWLHAKVTTLAGIKTALIKNAPQDKNRVPMWVIKIAKKSSLKLLPWIYYQDALPTLARKRATAMQGINAIAQEKRKTYNKIVAT